MKIPIIYQYLIEKINLSAYEKEIDVRKARDIIGRGLKLNRKITFKILCELKEMGLIEYINLKRIKINWKRHDLL